MKSNRRTTQPYIVGTDEACRLERIQLARAEQKDSGSFDEYWVQELIKDHPDILPINQLEPIFTPAVSIGREVSTRVGYIDNLFISPSGYITIVETKLWRNLEARREVVGQIIDYAQELSGWDYAQLDRSVREYSTKCLHKPQGLFELVQAQAGEALDETDFVDSVSANLSAGRFLLLIVGDGVREGIEAMSRFLNDKTGLHFTLGLVELQAFKVPSTSQRLILPQVVTHTTEVVRHVIRLENGQMAIQAEVSPSRDEAVPVPAKRTITSDAFFAEVAANIGQEGAAFIKRFFEELETLGCHIEWATATGSVRLQSMLSPGKAYSIFSVERSGKFYVGYNQTLMNKVGLPASLYRTYAEDTGKLFGKQLNDNFQDTWKGYADGRQLEKKHDDFLILIKRFIEDIREEEIKLS